MKAPDLQKPVSLLVLYNGVRDYSETAACSNISYITISEGQKSGSSLTGLCGATSHELTAEMSVKAVDI
jgi:hypothetical protein